MTVLAGAVTACADATSPGSAPALAASHASAMSVAATQTEFAGFVNFCVENPPSSVKITPGGTLHVRTSNENRWVTGNPLVDGVETNNVHLNLNLNNGNGVVHLDATLKPDAVNGTWQIRQTLTIRDGAPVGSTGVGHGTGDLQSLTIKFTTDPAVPVTNSCNPALASAPVHGTIS